MKIKINLKCQMFKLLLNLKHVFKNNELFHLTRVTNSNFNECL